jgi:hypothetical protein
VGDFVWKISVEKHREKARKVGELALPSLTTHANATDGELDRLCNGAAQDSERCGRTRAVIHDQDHRTVGQDSLQRDAVDRDQLIAGAKAGRGRRPVRNDVTDGDGQ